jgi:predicted MPP superfamily phosphohydrolase
MGGRGSRGLTRRAALRGLAAISAGTATGAFAHGFLYARHHVDVTHTSVDFSSLAPGLNGLRIGFISDLHRSRTVPRSLLDTAVQLLLREQPDLILLGGDYVTWGDRRFVEPVADVLAPLTAPNGVFAVLGNHDDDRDMPAALAAKGITVLRDQRTQLTIKGETLDLVGIRYWTRKIKDIAYVLRGASPNVILMAHTPSRLSEAAELAVPLMVSGHTHGGQIVLPGIGAVAAREYPVIAGVGQRQHTTAFVTRGVGTVYLPVRLNCPPEVAILTLKTSPVGIA